MDDWDAPPPPARRRRPVAAVALLALAVAGGLVVRGGALDGVGGSPGALDVDAGPPPGPPPAAGPDAADGRPRPDEAARPDPTPPDVFDGKAQGLVDDPDADDGADAGAWEVLPDAPLADRAGHVLVWSGEELLVWGGVARDFSARGEYFPDGAAYDPGAARWRALPPAPLEARSGHGAVWTGDELLVWGGVGATAHFADGAAYDPADGTWRVVAPSPLSPRQRPATVWTGEELVVAGGSDYAGPLRTAAAYSPSDDSWRPLADLPEDFAAAWNSEGAWIGDGVVVWADHNDHPAPGVRYDPSSDRWSTLPPLTRRGPVAAAWTGEDLLAVRGSALVAWRPGDDEWAPRQAPWGSSEPWLSRAHWSGTDLVVVRGADRPQVDVYDPAADRWQEGPAVPAGVGYGPSVWTGSALVLWGGSEHGPLGPSATGAAFRPGDPG